MLLLVSLFLIRTIAMPSASQALRERRRTVERRRHLELLFRDGAVANYRLD